MAPRAMEDQAIAALAQVEQSWGWTRPGRPGPAAAPARIRRCWPPRTGWPRPGVSVWLAIVIIAEIGLAITAFPTPAHLVSGTRLCRSAAQSGTWYSKGKQISCQATAMPAPPPGRPTWASPAPPPLLGDRYRRIARRRGKAIAQVAVARSIMIVVWHLLSDPAARDRASARTSIPAASTGTRRSAPTSRS
jgi:transposase